ncbi:unnamed protein product, partial [marine sediment metagenome]
IFAGRSPLSQRIILKIEAKENYIGVCTSSGTVGPSLSFGKADAVTVISDSVLLADAAATAVGNIINIRMQKVWLNDVEAYAGLAAVDVYLGATQLSENQGMEYGGAHVIEDLILGKKIKLKAISRGTDCYPRREIESYITKKSINQAILFNPRNGYQNYNVAVNTSDRKIYTYMGI